MDGLEQFFVAGRENLLMVTEASLVKMEEVSEMALAGVTEVFLYYKYLLSLGDRRVESWPLMTSPFPTIALTLSYLLLCRFGPCLMSRHPPFSLRPLVFLYNLSCAALNFYIGAEIYLTSRQLSYSWLCQPVDYSDDPRAVRIAAALWWYYVSKLYELLDSLFIILRKREKQLSFLHVYHHATMFPLWWIGAKYVAGGSSFLGAFFNCCVHVIMYSYYALSTLGERVRPYLWWKKYLTVLQMIQFIAALVMGLNAIRIGCDFPMWMQYSCIAYMVSFLVLFSDFYYKAYLAGREEGKEKDTRNGVNKVQNGLNKRHVESSSLNGNGIVRNGKDGIHNSEAHISKFKAH